MNGTETALADRVKMVRKMFGFTIGLRGIQCRCLECGAEWWVYKEKPREILECILALCEHSDLHPTF